MGGPQFKSNGVILDEALSYWIHRVYQATRNATFAAFDIGEEVTPEQWIVLVRLWEQDGRAQTELGQSTFRDRSTMSRILGGMERRGWIERHQDPSHGRVQLVFLTEAGKALRAELTPRAKRLVARQLRGISVEDLAVTIATLRRVFDNMKD